MNTVPAVLWDRALADDGRTSGLNAALTELYTAQYQPLVRLASMLVRDTGTAEEVVQDVFVALYCGWSGLRDTANARSYLHHSVVNRSRSVLRRRAVADKHVAALAPQDISADQPAVALMERSAMAAALRLLPGRQREALVLRFYADLSEADVAKAMGITRGAVKSHTARAVTTLRRILDDEASGGLTASSATNSR
jgi:RNA polymerase sigma-70 factor (sigma-E family)